jgi:hypothetical protein
MEFSQKIEMTIDSFKTIIWSCYVRISLQQTYLCTNVYCTTIHNWQVMESACAPQQMDFLKCGIYRQWSSIQTLRRTNPAIFRKMDETEDHHGKQNKPNFRKTSIMCFLSHMNLEQKKMTWSRTDYYGRERDSGTRGGIREVNGGEYNQSMSYVCVIISHNETHYFFN